MGLRRWTSIMQCLSLQVQGPIYTTQPLSPGSPNGEGDWQTFTQVRPCSHTVFLSILLCAMTCTGANHTPWLINGECWCRSGAQRRHLQRRRWQCA